MAARQLIHADDGSECENFMACQRLDVSHEWVTVGLGDPKPETIYQSKTDREKREAANEKAVYTRVTERDQSCCRVCGKFCNPRAVGVLYKAHHHHLIYRSALGPTTVQNVALICAGCHDAEHRHEIRLSGDAEARNEMGRLAGIKVERVTESGWQTEGWR